jgi:hypothetical protein
MRIYESLFLVACLLCLSIRLAGQAGAEYGAAAAAGATGAAASGKSASKSIGGVFDSLNKKLGKATGEQATAENSKAPPASPKAAPPKVVTLPAATPPAKAEPMRLVAASEIKIGTPRADLVREFGQPYVITSQADEAGFVQKYFYHGADVPVVVTFREGKVVRVTPPPDEKPDTPRPAPPEE